MAFDLIKKMFKKEQEVVELRNEELDEWFYQKADSAEQDMNSSVREYRQKFEDEVASTKENIKELRHAKLRNPNIPQREYDFMEGNRIAYMKKVVDLIKNIEFPSKAEHIPEFHKNFQEKLEEFTKQSYRPFTILNEFFADEISRIVENIKRFDQLDKELSERYESGKIPSMIRINKEIKDYSRSKEVISNLSQEIEDKKKQLENIARQIEDADKELAMLVQSEDHRKFKDTQSNIHQTSEDIKHFNQRFLSPFQAIQHPLKKYSKIAVKQTEWIDAYLEDAIGALRSDDQLVILEIMQSLLENSKPLSLNDKKMRRLKKNIKKLDKDFIESFKSDMQKLEGKKKKSETQKDDSIVRQIDDAKEKLESLQKKREIVRQHISDLETDMSKIDLEEMRENLVGKISDTFDVQIKLISG